MATLRKKRKLAAVSRETPESTRSGGTQNILDPELTQDYISQVSEEIEGRVTKKLSKEFSRTESRILGALSKLDEFLLNPQVRTCSVAVPGTSRSSNLENQGTNEDRPSDDPGPEVEFSSPLSGAEADPHMVTGVTRESRQHPHMTMETQEEIPYCSTSTSSGKKRRCAPRVSHNSAVRTPLRHLRQTRFCWPLNNGQRTVIQPISTIISAESQNCRNPSWRQCPRLMENQKNLNCLKVYSKRVWKSTTSWLKKTR